jgi:diacylglycerol O-acyltransferase / wax synthase
MRGRRSLAIADAVEQCWNEGVNAMTSIHRLSADDRVMLWPDALWPQEVAALAILDGASLLDSDANLRLDLVRATVGSRLRSVPRLRQLLYRPRRGLGGPLWVDAAAFDLTQHVIAVPVPPRRDPYG